VYDDEGITMLRSRRCEQRRSIDDIDRDVLRCVTNRVE